MAVAAFDTGGIFGPNDWRSTAFPNRALVSRKRDAPACRFGAQLRPSTPLYQRSCCATPVLLIFTPDARTVTRVDRFSHLRPLSRFVHSLRLSRESILPAYLSPLSFLSRGQRTILWSCEGGGGKKVWFGVSAKIGRFRRYVPVVRNRIVPCFRECITVIGPLEGASAKGSAGGKSVSGALPPTRVRFHASSLFTLNHLRDGGGGEGLAASMRNHRSKTLNDKLSVWNSKCWEISVEIGVRFANFRIGIKKWFKKKTALKVAVLDLCQRSRMCGVHFAGYYYFWFFWRGGKGKEINSRL